MAVANVTCNPSGLIERSWSTLSVENLHKSEWLNGLKTGNGQSIQMGKPRSHIYRPIVYAWWGHHPFKVENRVRLPVGWPDSLSIQAWLIDPRKRMKGETDKAPPEMVNQAKRAGIGLDWKGLFEYVPHVLTQTWWCEVNLRGPTGREGSLPQATGINAKGWFEVQ